MVMGRVRMERLLRRVLMLVDGELPLLLRPVAADGLHQQLLLRRPRLRLDGVHNLRLRFKLHLPTRAATGDSSQLQLLKARRLSNQDGVPLLKVSKDLLLRVHLPLNLPDGVLLLKVSKELLLRVRLLLNLPGGVLLLKVSKELLLRVHLLLSLPDGVLLLKDLLLRDHLLLSLLDGVLLLKVVKDFLLKVHPLLSLPDGVPLLQLLNLPRLVAGVLKHQLLLLPSTTTIIADGDLRRLVLPDGKESEATLDGDRPTDLRCFPCSFLGT
jgi:hypothetical protein